MIPGTWTVNCKACRKPITTGRDDPFQTTDDGSPVYSASCAGCGTTTKYRRPAPVVEAPAYAPPDSQAANELDFRGAGGRTPKYGRGVLAPLLSVGVAVACLGATLAAARWALAPPAPGPQGTERTPATAAEAPVVAKATPPTLRNVPPVKSPAAPPRPNADQERVLVNRLRKTDIEIMACFREGKRAEGFDKMMAVLAKYKKIASSECSPEESLAVGVIYARATTLFSLDDDPNPDKPLSGWLYVTKCHAINGGVDGESFDKWFYNIAAQTLHNKTWLKKDSAAALPELPQIIGR